MLASSSSFLSFFCQRGLVELCQLRPFLCSNHQPMTPTLLRYKLKLFPWRGLASPWAHLKQLPTPGVPGKEQTRTVQGWSRGTWARTMCTLQVWPQGLCASFSLETSMWAVTLFLSSLLKSHTVNDVIFYLKLHLPSSLTFSSLFFVISITNRYGL